MVNFFQKFAQQNLKIPP